MKKILEDLRSLGEVVESDSDRVYFLTTYANEVEELLSIYGADILESLIEEELKLDSSELSFVETEFIDSNRARYIFELGVVDEI